MSVLDNRIPLRCQGLFLDCLQFRDNQTLRAVFVTKELRPFQGKV
jgi:hypothetical protein